MQQWWLCIASGGLLFVFICVFGFYNVFFNLYYTLRKIDPNPTSKNGGSILMLDCIYCKLIKLANVRKHIVKTAVST